EYRFGSSARFQSEFRAAVPYQVKFHVTTSPEVLPLFFTICEAFSLINSHQVGIDRCEGAAGVQDKIEELLFRKSVIGMVGLQVIEENSAHAPGFFPVLQKKVVVGPLLEFSIKIWVMCVADRFKLLVKIPRLVF